MKLIRWSLTHSHVTSPLEKQRQGITGAAGRARGRDDMGDTGAPWAGPQSRIRGQPRLAQGDTTAALRGTEPRGKFGEGAAHLQESRQCCQPLCSTAARPCSRGSRQLLSRNSSSSRTHSAQCSSCSGSRVWSCGSRDSPEHPQNARAGSAPAPPAGLGCWLPVDGHISPFPLPSIIPELSPRSLFSSTQRPTLCQTLMSPSCHQTAAFCSTREFSEPSPFHCQWKQLEGVCATGGQTASETCHGVFPPQNPSTGGSC